MISKEKARDLVNDLFEEEALVIGGLNAVHDVHDDFIRRLIRNLDVIRGRVLHRLDESALPEPAEKQTARSRLKPHPAIEDFRLKLRGVQPKANASVELNPDHREISDEEMGQDDRATPASRPDEFIRLPGLFRRWELEQVLEVGKDFHIEDAGAAADGTPLFQVYRWEPESTTEKA